jgi:uncharacterized surface protein with fasciclin (FAS1) repeats
MKTTLKAATILAGLAFSAPAFAANIVETASSAGTFKTLIAAAKAAGLADLLATKGHLTVFAPTDAAFAALPAGTVESLLRPENKDKLVAILSYHVVGRAIPAAQIPTERAHVRTLKAAGDRSVAVRRQGGGVTVDNARVIKADIKADNGIIHVIDKVLIPSF